MLSRGRWVNAFYTKLKCLCLYNTSYRHTCMGTQGLTTSWIILLPTGEFMVPSLKWKLASSFSKPKRDVEMLRTLVNFRLPFGQLRTGNLVAPRNFMLPRAIGPMELFNPSAGKYWFQIKRKKFSSSGVQFKDHSVYGVSQWETKLYCLGMGSASERWHYTVMSFLIGWAHTQNDPCQWTAHFQVWIFFETLQLSMMVSKIMDNSTVCSMAFSG